MAILTVNEISKSFGGLQVLKRASLEVTEKSITGLVGPNGSGKSTLLHTIFGLLKPDAGSVFFQGRPVTGMAPHRIYRTGMAFSFQLPQLFPQLTVLDNLLLAARKQVGRGLYGALFLRRHWRQQEAELARKALRILDFLGLVPLALNAAAELSGGQRKLVEIGRALMADPTMLLLDEPAAGVNPVLGRKIYQKLQTLRDQGLSILVVEHKLEMLLDFADHIYLMDAGQIILSGAPKEVIDHPVFYATYIGETKNVTFPS